jgi:hypothetical protein
VSVHGFSLRAGQGGAVALLARAILYDAFLKRFSLKDDTFMNFIKNIDASFC